tara:strand:- start:2364 stop:2933 length:570 start_codon:yes stop_codon:yes gene_type:complete
MTLGFSTHINGKPTRFPEKIWNSLMHDVGLSDEEYYKWHGEDGKLNYNMGNTYDDNLSYLHPKKHTIRFMTPDRADQWEGKNIHFVIGNRTPQRFQFAPLTKVTGIQRIHFRFNVGHIEIEIDEEVWAEVFHHGIDDIYEYTTDLEELAKNDGFNGVEDFIAYFNQESIEDARNQGKYPYLIHWTNLKY